MPCIFLSHSDSLTKSRTRFVGWTGLSASSRDLPVSVPPSARVTDTDETPGFYGDAGDLHLCPHAYLHRMHFTH